jgi:hypothetical protein
MQAGLSGKMSCPITSKSILVNSSRSHGRSADTYPSRDNHRDVKSHKIKWLSVALLSRCSRALGAQLQSSACDYSPAVVFVVLSHDLLNCTAIPVSVIMRISLMSWGLLQSLSCLEENQSSTRTT